MHELVIPPNLQDRRDRSHGSANDTHHSSSMGTDVTAGLCSKQHMRGTSERLMKACEHDGSTKQ
eukprot:scaffold7936_cov19-Tisochrysis_lutea.AAC.4